MKQDNSVGVTLARFGDARVVLDDGSQVGLVGGTERERSEAMEWLGLFLTPHQCAALEGARIPVPYELWSMSTI
jgi:hypothetical protein